MELFRLFGTIGLNGVDEAQRDINDTVDTAERGESKMTSSFKKIGTAVATYFAVDKIVEFGKSIVDASATVSAEVSAFEQIMGDYSDTAQEKMKEVADATGVVDTRLTGYMTSMTAKFKGLGYDIDEATTLASDGLLLASDASAFWDKSLEDSMSALNSFINGNYEGGEAIGLFANETQLSSWAIKNGIIGETKEWANLDEARKQATRLEYAQEMFAMSGATGQASKEADQYANVQANLNEKWRQFKAQIGEPILQNVVLPALTLVSGVVDGLSVTFENVSGKVQDLWNKFTQTEMAIESLSQFQSVIDTLKSAWDIIFPSLQALWDVFITHISAMWNSFGKPLWDTFIALVGRIVDMFNQYFPQIASVVSDVFNIIAQVYNGILKPIFDLIGQAVQFLANMFMTNFGFILTYVQIAFEGIKFAWDMILYPLIQLIIQVVSSVVQFIADIMSQILSTITTIWNNIKTNIQTVLDMIKRSVTNVFGDIKQIATDVWNAIKQAIQKPIEDAKNFVKDMIDKIRSFFNFEWSLPKLKMPHIKISGEFSLLPPSAPSFSIEWYAKGGIFDTPTIFPTMNGLKGVGEAGAEAVTPINVLLDYVRTAVKEENANVSSYIQKLIDMLSEYMPQLVNGMDRQIILDGGALVGALAPQMDLELGDINKGRGRGQ